MPQFEVNEGNQNAFDNEIDDIAADFAADLVPFKLEEAANNERQG